MKKIGLTILAINLCLIGKLQSQTLASFSLSLNSTALYGFSDAGWTNVYGDPYTGVRTATANGITISSVSTANWVSDNSSCAEDNVGATGGTFFPAHILLCHWYQYSSTLAGYNQAVPQLKISGLNKDSFYILRMSSSYLYGTNADPTQYTVAGRTVAPSQDFSSYNNTSMGITFLHVYPDSNGVINVYVNTTTGKSVSYLSGIQIISGTSTVGIPTVTINSPANNDILAEESNITINASASETGSSITKVEFFADTTKIGEDDTAPYSVIWDNPNEGNYMITARATDASGTANSATINISVQSLTSFWSMTGNINMNPDSNFVGNVDSVRLAFRTNNIERMSVLANGNVGIGTTNTQGYKLAVNGSAIFTKVRIKAYSGWPDYVFDKRYKLLPLDSLGKYIDLHKHLPGIAAEGEVKKEALDIADQQAILLKKIEELTLYIIQDHDRLKELSNQVKRLETENKKLKAKNKPTGK